MSLIASLLRSRTGLLGVLGKKTFERRFAHLAAVQTPVPDQTPIKALLVDAAGTLLKPTEPAAEVTNYSEGVQGIAYLTTCAEFSLSLNRFISDME